jgi:hypothetical protein
MGVRLRITPRIGHWWVDDDRTGDPVGYFVLQFEAIAAARETALRDGGGEVVIYGPSGHIVDEWSVEPCNELEELGRSVERSGDIRRELAVDAGMRGADDAPPGDLDNSL